MFKPQSVNNKSGFKRFILKLSLTIDCFKFSYLHLNRIRDNEKRVTFLLIGFNPVGREISTLRWTKLRRWRRNFKLNFEYNNLV